MRRSAAGDDPTVRELREEIAENDRAIVAAINQRLLLVARLKQVKAARGLEFLDPEREAWMERHLAEANGGPLSPDGLRAIYAELLDLTKREVASEQ